MGDRPTLAQRIAAEKAAWGAAEAGSAIADMAALLDQEEAASIARQRQLKGRVEHLAKLLGEVGATIGLLGEELFGEADPMNEAQAWAALASIVTLVLTEAFRRWKTAADARKAEAETKHTEATAGDAAAQALAGAFTTISESLKIIHDLRAQLASVEQDLKGALSTIRDQQAELEIVRREKTDLQARLDLALGEARELKQVVASTATVRRGTS